MNAGLVDVERKRSGHADGPDDDLPELSRALWSFEPEVRTRALARLERSALHPRSRSAPVVVQVLVDALGAPYPRALAGVLRLLARLVAGPAFSPIAGSRHAGPEARSADPRGREEARSWGKLAAAAAPGVAVAKRLLGHWLSEVREAAAYFLAGFRTVEPDHGLIAALRRRLAIERDPVVRACVVFALGHLIPLERDDRVLLDALADREPAVQVVAAILLARRHRTEAPGAAIDVLARALAQPGPAAMVYAIAPWRGSLVEHCREALGRCGHVPAPSSEREAELDWLVVLALRRAALGALHQATAALRELEALAPGSAVAAGAYLAIGDACQRRAPSRAWWFYEQAVRVNAGDGQAHLALGRALCANGEVRAGERALAAATERLADPRPALHGRMIALWTLDRYDDALAVVERLYGHQPPTEPDGWYTLANALVKTGRYAETIAAARHVLDVHPDHADAHYCIACAYALSGDPPHALAHIEQAIAHDLDLAPSIAGDRDFASIATDARFRRIVTLHPPTAKPGRPAKPRAAPSSPARPAAMRVPLVTRPAVKRAAQLRGR